MSKTKPIARLAKLRDVPSMMPLLNEYARRAEILPRQENEVYQSIREWMIVEADGQIVGAGSLLILWGDIAEIRSLVVAPEWQGRGVGRSIVTALIAEARKLELPTAFALTRKANFFLRLGFELTDMHKLPRKVMKDCVFCPKFQACDELAVIYTLSKTPPTAAPAAAGTAAASAGTAGTAAAGTAAPSSGTGTSGTAAGAAAVPAASAA